MPDMFGANKNGSGEFMERATMVLHRSRAIWAGRALAGILAAFPLGGCERSPAAGPNGTTGEAPAAALIQEKFAAKSEGCASVGRDDGPGAGTPETHGAPQREEGPVQVTQHPSGMYLATRIIGIWNDFGGASRSELAFSTQGADSEAIILCPRVGGGYRFEVRLEALAQTEQQARAGVASLRVENIDALDSGALRLQSDVRAQDFLAGAVLPTSIGIADPGVLRSAVILAGLPTSVSYSFHGSTSSGTIGAIAFNGSRAELNAGGGDTLLAGSWDESFLSAENGTVLVAGDHPALTVSSDNGSIYAWLLPARTSLAQLDSSNGDA